MVEWDKVVYIPALPGEDGSVLLQARISFHASQVVPEEVNRYLDDKEKRARLRAKIARGIYGEVQDGIKGIAADLNWFLKQPIPMDAGCEAIRGIVSRLADLAESLDAPHAAGENWEPAYAVAGPHWPNRPTDHKRPKS